MKAKRILALVLAAMLALSLCACAQSNETSEANVSTSTAGTFMLTRARQGKEALACIILPLLFYELFYILKAEGQVKITDFLILISTSSAAALSSFLGNVLVPLMLFGAGIWMLVKRKGFKNIFLLAAATVINLLAILVYFKIN